MTKDRRRKERRTKADRRTGTVAVRVERRAADRREPADRRSGDERRANEERRVSRRSAVA